MARLISFLLLIISHSYAYAGPVIWTGAGDGLSWEDSNNWDGGSLPTLSDQVEITSGNVTLNTGSIELIESLKLGGTLTISVTATLAIEGSSLFGIELTGTSGKIIINGIVNIENTSSVGLVFIDGEVEVGSTGVLNIDDSFGHSTFGNYDDNFINNGLVSLKNAAGTAFQGNLINSGIFETEATSSIAGKINNSGTITMFKTFGGITFSDSPNINTGTITLDSLTSQPGISFNSAENVDFTNSGTIDIIGHAGIGISSDGEENTLTNLAGGVISISGTGGNAFRTNFITSAPFTLTNEGSILMQDITENAFYIKNTNINNQSTGSILIDLADGGVISQSGNNTISNNGIFEIKNTQSVGINISGFNNTLTNMTLGNFLLENCGTSAVIGAFENQGIFTINNGCTNVAVDGDIINSGPLTLSNLSNGGIAGSFTNSATVNISNLSATGLSCYQDKLFNNSGTVTLADIVGTNISCSGSGSSFYNSGSISITNATSNAIVITGGSGGSNTTDGTITINGAFTGLNVSNCFFDVDGLIDINNTTSNAVRTSADSDFTILQTGELNIVNAQNGLTALSGAIVENYGTIKMKSTISGIGIQVIGGAQFTNFHDANLNVNKSAFSCISVDNGTITNFGNMDFISDFTAISNLAQFRNRSTGNINILGFGNVGITNSNAGTFDNQGSLEITKNGSPVDIQNILGGSFVNTGTIICRE